MKRIREIHVVPLWCEKDRVLGPIREYTPDVVYLLEHDRVRAERPAYHDATRETLEDLVPTVETCAVDLFDMYDVMGAVTTIADEHEADLVRVNVTAGTKRTAIGATMACMDAGTDAEPYVVDPDDRSAGVDEPLTTGYDGASALTTYPIDSPTPDQVAALAIVDAHDTGAKRAKKRTLLTEGAEQDLEFLRGRAKTNGHADEYEPSKGDYNVLKREIVDPIVDRGYATVEANGTRNYLELTEEGRQTLRAFRQRAESVVRDLEKRSVMSDEIDFELDDPTEGLFEAGD